jgi:hypothetical protein
MKMSSAGILPLGTATSDGQMNLAYFELTAGIYNSNGKQVGLCVMEFLPGARNPQKKINFLNLFRKVQLARVDPPDFLVFL